jgi:hypothetical protein
MVSTLRDTPQRRRRRTSFTVDQSLSVRRAEPRQLASSDLPVQSLQPQIDSARPGDGSALIVDEDAAKHGGVGPVLEYATAGEAIQMISLSEPLVGPQVVGHPGHTATLPRSSTPRSYLPAHPSRVPRSTTRPGGRLQ